MLFKLLIKDLLRRKTIAIVLLIFIALSIFLLASGSNMIYQLVSSTNNLFLKADVPHFVQMHSGKINKKCIHKWANKNKLIEKMQIVEMINIDNDNIYLENSAISENNSVMNIDFVVQNTSFDFLLNLKNKRINISKGEIAVPIYFMKQNSLRIGDKVKISAGSFHKEFEIVTFLRDALMNPSIVHSKRFLINKEDFNFIKKHNIGNLVYLMEFKLKNINDLNKYTNQYQLSQMPQKGPTLNYKLFKILNAMSDGIIIAIIVFVSILTIIITMLCLRLTIIAAIEEDFREIGIMKAIGLKKSYIRKTFLSKYSFLTIIASILGYCLFIFYNKLFIINILLYIGASSVNYFQYLIPLSVTAVTFIIIIIFCFIIFIRHNKISIIEAIRNEKIWKSKLKYYFSLKKYGYFFTNIYLALKDIIIRVRMFLLLFFIFCSSTFLIIVSINFYNTIKSPSFVRYLGIGKSDIRIDIQQLENTNNIISHIENDKEIKCYSLLRTCRYKIINKDGSHENFNIETGNYKIFPLEFLRGHAPKKKNEIALSCLNSKELGKHINDEIQILINNKKINFKICGIYQDVTNGGRTAKAILPVNNKSILWDIININVKNNVDITDKVKEYKKIFDFANVISIKDYVDQTLGDLIIQLGVITIIINIIAVFISVLITTLFLKMLIIKDNSQIAILKSIGFTVQDIRLQYTIKTLIILFFGILAGIIISNSIGQIIISFLWSFLGASDIIFIVKLFHVYIFVPIFLFFVITITVFATVTVTYHI